MEMSPVMLRLKGGADGGRAQASTPARVGSFTPQIARSRSTLWFEGYNAGCMQFLQSYEPDHRDGKPLVVGLAGGTGSGKSTIKDVILEQLSQIAASKVISTSEEASQIAGRSGGSSLLNSNQIASSQVTRATRESVDNVAVLSHDNYYKHRTDLSDEERDKINFDHPDSLDTALLVHHLKELLEGRAVECPIYDFATHLRKQNETIRVEPRPIILVEGILIFCDKELRDNMNLKIYVDVEADRRILRRIERDLMQRGRNFSSIVTQYLETVKPMHDRYVEPSKQHADIIIPFVGRNVAAIQVLLERLKAHLRNNFAYLNSQNFKNHMSAHGDEQLDEYLSAPRSQRTPIYHSPRTSDIQLPYENGASETSQDRAASISNLGGFSL